MTRGRALLCTLAIVLAATLPLAAQAVQGAAPPASAAGKAGDIRALLPVAHILRGTGKRAVRSEAKKGDELIWDDLVKTEVGGRARITLVDQSILSLGSQAELKIVKHDARSQQTVMQLGYGRLRAQVSKILREGGKFELRTPTAVAGVIGTDFGIDASDVGSTKFLCISGLVEVSNIDPNVPGTVQCAPGMSTSVSAGKPPAPPTNAPAEEIQQLIQDTEPAVVSAISPASVLAGSSANVAITGSKLSGIANVEVSGDGALASLAGPTTDAAAAVDLVTVTDAAPGPRTITLTKEDGAAFVAVFTILSPPGEAAPGQDPKDPYAEVFQQERYLEGAGLSAYLAEVRQARDAALQLWQQANATGVDLSEGVSELNEQIAAIEAAIERAKSQTDAATAAAVEAFDEQYQSAWDALKQRNPEGTPDDTFNQELQTAFKQLNNVLGGNFNDVRSDLATLAQTAGNNIAQLGQKWLTTLEAAARQTPTPSVNSIERSIDVGASFGSDNIVPLDASSSKAAGDASIVRYQWVLCDPSYKPAQFGVPIAVSTTGCNALPGFASSSSDFSFGTCSLNPGDYIARVAVYDSNSQASAMDVKVHVLAPTYDDPPTVLRNLADAYGSLQMRQFLSYFDETNFPGYNALAENIRNTFPTLGTMNINLVISQSSTSCSTSPAGEATVRADWQLNYTLKQICEPIANTDPVQQTCSDPSLVYQDKEQLSVRMMRTPGKGWFIVDFQGDNGTVQGKFAGPSVDAVNFQLALTQPMSPEQIVLVGDSAAIPITLTETGSAYPLPITVGPANGSLTYTVPSSPMLPGTQTITVASSAGMATGNFPVTVTAGSYGLTQSVTQALNFVSAKIKSSNLLLNDASNPLEIQIGQPSLSMLPNVQLTLESTFFSGSATVFAPPPTLGFNSMVDNGATTTVGPNGTFTLQITASYGASTTVIRLTLTAQLPNSNPPAIVQYTLYVKAIGVPDLQVVSATPLGGRSITSAEPWIDGEPIDFDVEVRNNSKFVPSAGGEEVICRLRGYDVGRTTAPPLAPGESRKLTSPLHCVAPDIDGDGPGPATAAFSVRIEPDRAGDFNYANNKLDAYYPWSNWHVFVHCPDPKGLDTCLPDNLVGNGTANDPVQVTYLRMNLILSVDGYLDSGNVWGGNTFRIDTGVYNDNYLWNSGNWGTSTGPRIHFAPHISALPGSQDGTYIMQAVVKLLDGGNITAQRQATIYFKFMAAGNAPTDTLTLTSSANNCATPSAGGACANATANTVQINGKLVEQVELSLWRSGCPIGSPCAGSVDLSFTDAPNTATTPPLNPPMIPFGQQQTIRVAALLDPNDVISSPGDAANYTVSATAVQAPPVVVARAQTPGPSPAGVTFQLKFNVGDINITPYSASCVKVPPGGSVSLDFDWQPVFGFNAPLQWEWEDGSYALVDAAPLSFTPASGSDASTTGAYGALPTFKLKNTQPLDGLQTYFFAIKLSNAFSSATKWYPFYFDLSTSQNFCGALLSSARGFAGTRGTWSRTAGGGGGITTSAARSRTTGTTSGQPDLRLSASDISFTPSLPKAGDTVQVRFRVSNQGDADARGVPIALQVNGISVAMDRFDVPAGSSALGALEWKAASLPSRGSVSGVSSRPVRPRGRFRDADAADMVERGLPKPMLRAQLVIDPQHTLQQKTTLGKSAVLPHFALREGGASGAPGGAGMAAAMAGSQRILLEMREGACVGLRLTTGSAGPCGTADVEITVDDADRSGITLSSLSGVADLGVSFAVSNMQPDSARLAGARYVMQTAGIAGHSYAVKLNNGQAALLIIASLRNPEQLSAAARKTFRANALRVLRRMGGNTGPPEPEDVAGAGDPKGSLFLEVMVQRQ